jgi:hypothetical protein
MVRLLWERCSCVLLEAAFVAHRGHSPLGIQWRSGYTNTVIVVGSMPSAGLSNRISFVKPGLMPQASK